MDSSPHSHHLGDSVTPVHMPPSSGSYSDITQHHNMHATGDGDSPYAGNGDGGVPVSNNMVQLPQMHHGMIGEVSQSVGHPQSDGHPQLPAIGQLRNGIHGEGGQAMSEQSHIPFDGHNRELQYATQPLSQGSEVS